mgnify:CR=1 FL=1
MFDTINQANYDEEYLPQSGWTSKKYKQKLSNLARVIVGIGTNDQQKESPTILGVCEIENKGVHLVEHGSRSEIRHVDRGALSAYPVVQVNEIQDRER